MINQKKLSELFNRAIAQVRGLWLHIIFIIVSGVIIVTEAKLTAFGFLVVSAGVLYYFFFARRVQKVEGSLKDIELQWQTLVREAPALISVLSREGAILFINRRLPQTGLFVNAEISVLLSLDVNEKEKLRAVIDRVFTEKKSIRYESHIVLANGNEVFFDNSVGPIIKEGVVHSVILVAIDITERKKAEDEAKILSAAMDQSPISVIITDPSGKAKYVNPFFTKISGYSLEEIKGKPLSILQSGVTSQEKYVDLWRTIREGKIWRGVIENRKKNGDSFWEFISVAPVQDEYGKISHYIGVKEDVTERRRIEMVLKDNERSLSELIDAIPSPLFYRDKQGVYLGCNQAFMECLGLSKEKIIGKTFLDVGSSEFSREFNEGDLDLLAGKGRRSYESRIRYADGKEHDVVIYKSCLASSSGDSRGLIGVLLDVSEIKQIQQELMDNHSDLVQAMESLKQFNLDLEKTQDQLVQSEKLAAIGFLAAGVAHEINNPLAFIRGNLASFEEYVKILLEVLGSSYLLRDAVNSGDLAHIKDARRQFDEVEEKTNLNAVLGDIHALINETKEGVERIKVIVQDLRRFSRTDSSQMAPANIHDVLDAMINIAWNELKYKVELVKEYGDVPLVMCNVQQLGQVFLNMLVNAVQAIQERGIITVRSYLRDGNVCVDISDTGAGISPENLTKIFDPFFTTKLPGKGTGLGLSISYDIIKKHSGSIEVHSTVGIGTTFTVVLTAAMEGNLQ